MPRVRLFSRFLRRVPAVERPLLVGAEAAGFGLETDKHGASLTLGYPGVGPEHSCLKDEGLVRYAAVTDREAVDAFALLCRTEGIIPAIESSHALALLPRLAEEFGPRGRVIVNLSGRGDKDVDIVREAGLGLD